MGYEKANEILAPMFYLTRLEALQNAPETMTPYEEWIRRSKAELMQVYMNAFTTMSCMGHGNAERNEHLVKHYAELMKKYNVPIPDSDIWHILGIFNGKGAS